MHEASSADPATPALEIRRLSFGYAKASPVLSGFDLSLERGEVVAVLGDSGCGKTTLLRLVGGLERPGDGTICIDGRLVADARVCMPAERRSIGYVFQDLALFPHLSVIRNVTFGMRGTPRRSRRTEAEHLLASLGLEGMSERMPGTLSGGQQQRVAVARALASRPRLILLDEPFSAIDTRQRERTRELVIGRLRSAGVATLLVTHNQDEADTLADRIVRIGDRDTSHATSPQHSSIADPARAGPVTGNEPRM
ncbi:MAG: ABC transporter ATP-binding protein [Planctomycetota bacterium]